MLDGKTRLLDPSGLSIEGRIDQDRDSDSVLVVIAFIDEGDERFDRIVVDEKLELIIGQVPRANQSALLGRYTHQARITFP